MKARTTVCDCACGRMGVLVHTAPAIADDYSFPWLYLNPGAHLTPGVATPLSSLFRLGYGSGAVGADLLLTGISGASITGASFYSFSGV